MSQEARRFSLSQETKEKVWPNQLVFLGEPILKKPPKNDTSLQVPKSDLPTALDIIRRNLSGEEIEELLENEYIDIALTLLKNKVPFRFIAAHDDLVSVPLVLWLNERFGIKGVRFFKEIPAKFTCFPKDMLFDLDGKILINPQANLMPVQDSIATSLLGEGGNILKRGKKIILPSNLGYTKGRNKFEKDVKKLLRDYNVGFLPWPFGVEVRDGDKTIEEFPSTHLDRVVAFIEGKDGRDYLLVDPNYINERKMPWGSYKQELEMTTKGMDITLLVVDRRDDDVPYSLNLVQFNDNSVFMSNGHKSLEALLKQIVGEDKVFTTNHPVIHFPILRRGGLSCMILFAPKRLLRPLPQSQS